MKIFLIRYRLHIYLMSVVLLVIIAYTQFGLEHASYDIWEIISLTAKEISDKNLPVSANILTLVILCLALPVLFTYTIYSFLLPINPSILLNKIKEKPKNTAELCYSLLENYMHNFLNDTKFLSNGLEVSQTTANLIQENILPIIGRQTNFNLSRKEKKWYATSLLDPNDLWDDKNNKATLINSLINAKERDRNLTRFIITNDLNKHRADLESPNSSLYKIAKLHERYDHDLHLVDAAAFNKCWASTGVEKEYLDFLLIDDSLVVGLKNIFTKVNGSFVYETITKNENYIVFIREEKTNVQPYTKLIEKLNSIIEKQNYE